GVGRGVGGDVDGSGAVAVGNGRRRGAGSAPDVDLIVAAVAIHGELLQAVVGRHLRAQNHLRGSDRHGICTGRVIDIGLVGPLRDVFLDQRLPRAGPLEVDIVGVAAADAVQLGLARPVAYIERGARAAGEDRMLDAAHHIGTQAIEAGVGQGVARSPRLAQRGGAGGGGRLGRGPAARAGYRAVGAGAGVGGAGVAGVGA